MLRLTVALALALSLAPCRAAAYRVSPSPPGPAANGLTWATAFPTVQQALDKAASGDEVWVAAGTYYETVTLKSGVGLYGGFAGTETNREQRSWEANPTALDGQYKGTVVTIAADATSQTVVDGFTIRLGSGTLVGDTVTAGGIYVQGGNPIISHNVIKSCVVAGGRTTVSDGGGIYVAAGMPLIAGNTITGNHAMFGGGICGYGGLIRDNVISNNSAGQPVLVYGRGGGISAWGTKVVIVHNLIEGNEAYDSYGGGGGMWAVGATVIDNVFLNNAGQHGGAVQAHLVSTLRRNTILDLIHGPISEVEFDGGTFSNNLVVVCNAAALVLGYNSGAFEEIEPAITNNTLIKAGEQADTAVWSLYYNGERPVFSNNTVIGWLNAGRAYGTPSEPPVFTTDHNDLTGNGDNTLKLPGASQVGENGNISADPLFVDAANGDYRLQAGSPCIDAGNDATVSSGDRDLLGAPRIAGAHVDIGCYEYGSPAWTMLDAAEVLKVAAGLSLSTPAEVSRLDVAAEGAEGGRLSVADATRIARWLLN